MESDPIYKSKDYWNDVEKPGPSHNEILSASIQAVCYEFSVFHEEPFAENDFTLESIPRESISNDRVLFFHALREILYHIRSKWVLDLQWQPFVIGHWM